MADTSKEIKRKSILVVDDDPSYTKILQMALESWGYTAYVAANGEEALNVFKQKAPSLIITDLWMPKLDGLGLLRSMKSLDPKVYVILLTAHKTINAAVMAMECGAIDFLSKPVDYKKLKALIEKLLSTAS